MKKLKKYLLMVPLLAVMLLNCVCYGQVIFSANAIDYNEYFKSLDDCLVSSEIDFTDSDFIMNKVFQHTGNYPYYFYSIYLTPSEYSKFESGQQFKYKFICVLTDNLNISNLQDHYVLNGTSKSFASEFIFTPSDDTISPWMNSGVDSYYDKYFVYFKNTGSFVDDKVSSSISYYTNQPFYCDEYIYFYQYTNIPDFPFFYDFESSQSAMNVSVNFSPELTGAFNRTVTDRGQKVTLDEFSFTVENNSKFDVQYLMAIHKIDDSFYPFPDPINAGYMTVNGKTYTGSPVYVYVKDEWLFLPHGVQGIITAYAPSSWHKVSAGSVDSVTVNFNQLKLNSVDVYDVEVYAVRNDFNYVSPFTNHNTFNYPASADCSIVQEDVQLVYSSRFNIANPAEFDPNNNENSYAYDEDDRFLFNRANGYIDENGETVIDRVDTNQFVNAGNDPDDPWRGWDDSNDAWEYYYKNQNTVSSDIDQLSNNFSSFFKFVNKVFSYFPKNYQNIIMLGLTSIVVLAVIKVVF